MKNIKMSFFILLEKKGNFGVFEEFFGEFGHCADFIRFLTPYPLSFNTTVPVSLYYMEPRVQIFPLPFSLTVI